MDSSAVAIIGSGPTAFMAADMLSANGVPVHIFEQDVATSRKLYIAGASGLNISFVTDDPHRGSSSYSGDAHWQHVLAHFNVQDWLTFINEQLQLATYAGTSRRYFLKAKNAAPMVKVWRERLKIAGVTFHLQHELTDFTALPQGGYELKFLEQASQTFTRVVLCCGGASYIDRPLVWPQMLQSKGIAVTTLAASNVGFELDWPQPFVVEAEGLPLKNICLTTSRGAKRGDLVVTNYGLEGTPIYTIGAPGPCSLDLRPDLTAEALTVRLEQVQENLSPLRRATKALGLDKATQALLFHCTMIASATSNENLAALLKAVPLRLVKPRPIAEAISTTGGVALPEVNADLMLHKFPNVYCGGEMLDWDAPTGGFLLQGCVSQGAWIARAILAHKVTS